MVNGKHIKSCLGDLFSVNFLEDTDKGDYKQTLDHQFETIKRLTTKSHVMQWGDRSFSQDPIGEFMRGPSSLKTAPSMRLLRPLKWVGRDKGKESVMDSRTNKLQSLAAAYSIDRSHETFLAMQREMQSMRNYDRTFKDFSTTLGVNGDYNPSEIHFDCLRAGVEAFESQCEPFSDYGLGKIKYIADACEEHSASEVVSAIHC